MSEPKQVMIRTAPEDHERWKVAAEREGKTLSDFVRDTVNAATSEILDCQHEDRLEYPWAAFCKRCGVRLRG